MQNTCRFVLLAAKDWVAISIHCCAEIRKEAVDNYYFF